MENLFITSDLHFYHKNIIKYCNRPYEFTWEAVAKMNEDILKQFDELPAGSTIINNGDIGLNSSLDFDKLKYLVDRMKSNNKKLWIILGNHDRDMHLRCKSLRNFKSAEELFEAIGFDKVFSFPILLENKYLLSHEPVYLKPGCNLINVYAHTHDIDIDENYFNRDCENWAMVERVIKEGISENLEYPDTSVKPLGLFIDTSNYFNVCWDKHHRILKFDEVRI